MSSFPKSRIGLHEPDPLSRLRAAGTGAFFRPSDAEEAGMTYYELRQLVSAGSVEHVARGLYRLADVEPTEDYSLAAACARVPRAIICLLSALRVHGIGTQVPNAVWLAVPHRSRAPRLPGIRARIVRFSGAALTYGVVETEFEGVPARITDPVRTVVDCFRYERLVGREAAREALHDARSRKLVTVDALYRAVEVLPSRQLRHILEFTAP
jgi:predicted transcriptional regulator of viral defense system